MITFTLDNGNIVTIRGSGTEPKIKVNFIYIFIWRGNNVVVIIANLCAAF